MIVEYAGVVAAMAILTATLTGAYGQSLSAAFSSQASGVAAVARAARAQHVPAAGAKAAYRRAPYAKPALKYLYAAGWIAGAKSRAQCYLMAAAEDAARRQAERELRGSPRIVGELRKRGVGVRAAARAVVQGLRSACPG